MLHPSTLSHVRSRSGGRRGQTKNNGSTDRLPCLSSCKSSRYSTPSSLNRVNAPCSPSFSSLGTGPSKAPNLWELNQTKPAKQKHKQKSTLPPPTWQKTPTNNKTKKNILHKTIPLIPYLFKQTLYAIRLQYYFKHLFSGARSALKTERNCCFSFSGSSMVNKYQKARETGHSKLLGFSCFVLVLGLFFKVPLKKKHLNKTITFTMLTRTL